MEALLLVLVESAGSELASQIAERLADGLNLDFLKSKEDKLEQELKVLQNKIDELGRLVVDTIKKQRITDAANRVRNCFTRLEKAAKVQDAKRFADGVKLIDSQDGVQDRLDDMNAMLMNDEGKGSQGLLAPLAQEQWDKLQDGNDLKYGIQELEREQEATLKYTIMIERLGLALVLLYHRTREDIDKATRAKTMAETVKNSDERVKAWRDLWDDRKRTCPAYDTLWSEIKRQTASEPVYKAPFIRTIQAALDDPKVPCQAGHVLNAEMLQRNWRDDWREPTYAIHQHEWDLSFKPDTGRWTIHSTHRLVPYSTIARPPRLEADRVPNPMCSYLDAKLIPLPNPPKNQHHIRVRCANNNEWWTIILVILPLTLPPSVQLSNLTSWNSGSARTFLARVENHSSYTLIPRRRRVSSRGDLYGVISSFECPVLPGGTCYLAGHTGRALTGGTGLFEYAIWSSPPAITDSSQESEKKFHDLKCFEPSRDYYDEQVGYQPQVGASYLGTLILMVSVSYGGNPKGAMYASDYWASEIVSLKDEECVTGDYKYTGANKREMKVVNVEWDIQQGDHVGQPGTWFKVCNK
ncbi:uncharacterized protein J4E92_007135 [Alternaria infectoria]|uniref:uncharacterized protein n=1 Tax=Alternaria infectoria TaxID=45303 RepID=UPI002220F001|nr:uncharacterized protein J4E92_007135 [Alternaria infectoria]KAI4925097.1 hypothetical protein J4E92_007135 [Alternaria infectoria]